MAAYVIAEVSVTDPDGYEQYKPLAGASVAAAGGTYLARGGTSDSLEGDPVAGRIVILRFDTLDAARAWYHSDAYQAAVPLRQAASEGRVYIVEGAEPQ
ncbi:MAG: DUF1330 domain-containing protein [Ilumatobacteraceae bacterium]